MNIDQAVNFLITKAGGATLKIEKPDDELILDYQKKLNIFFLSEYVFFLKNASFIYYGTLMPAVITYAGNSRLELKTIIDEARSIGVPKAWLPFCEDNGNYYCLLEDGTVAFFDHNGRSDEKWQSLADWIIEVWIGELT